ncbi:hypothetical protein Aperf_G00000048434 [Anoplocephala perfoliata]
MVSLDFSDVDWYLVLAVSLGKTIVFFGTMTVVLLFSRGKSFGLAGILAIFVSQTNDVALAYPVLRLLYPKLANYTYLFAPTQLVILNPFGYFALEWHRTEEKLAARSASAPLISQSFQGTSMLTFKRVLEVMRLLACNPLVFMTALGVIFNFILKHKLPDILFVFFDDLGASFSATALFYLGFSMVGKLRSIGRRGVYILVFILIGKLILTPFITREVTLILTANQPRNVSYSKSNFAFLYSIAPTAPPVFLFASQFGIVPEVISAGLVIGTFLYAPIMFLLGGLITLLDVDPKFYDNALERAAVYLSLISLTCCAWVLTVLLATKKVCRMPYRFLLCLIISVMIFCTTLAIGSINQRTTSDVTWGQYIQFIVFFIACTASRVWTALLSVAVLFQVRYNRPLSNPIQILFYALGLVIPTVAMLILMVSAGSVSSRDINPAFQYRKAQDFSDNGLLPSSVGVERRPLISAEAGTRQESPILAESPTLPSDDEIREREHAFGRHGLIGTNDPPESDMTSSQSLHSSSTTSFHRFFLLIILLMISMFFGVCVCIWRLAREAEAGFFIAMEFLDQVFNFGQGILIFSIFGIDTDIVINPIIKCISALRYWVMNRLSSSSLRMPRRLKEEKEEEEIELFVANQLPICMQQICSTIRLPDKTLESVFYFNDFCQWISQKLAVEGRQQSREDTASLLMALADRNLIRRLSSVDQEVRDDERAEAVDISLPNSATTSLRPPCNHTDPEESPILFQFLASS